MSKGPKPPKKQPPLNPRDPVDEPPVNPECWTFVLVELTSAGRSVKNGASVTGSVTNNRVLILGSGNALGFASDHIGIQIVVAASQQSNPKLLGNVISGEGSEEVTVKLCLR